MPSTGTPVSCRNCKSDRVVRNTVRAPWYCQACGYFWTAATDDNGVGWSVGISGPGMIAAQREVIAAYARENADLKAASAIADVVHEEEAAMALAFFHRAARIKEALVASSELLAELRAHVTAGQFGSPELLERLNSRLGRNHTLTAPGAKEAAVAADSRD